MKTWITAGLATLFLAGCAANGDATANKDGLICKMVKPTGSNIPTRVCLTQEEMAEQEKQGKKLISDLQQK